MSASTGDTPLTILYSYNKRGFEADYWFRELTAASDDRFGSFRSITIPTSRLANTSAPSCSTICGSTANRGC